MKNLILALLLLGAVYTEEAQEIRFYRQMPHQYIKGIQTIKELVQQGDITYLIVYVDFSSSTNTLLFASIIHNVAVRLEHLAEVLLVNCAEPENAEERPCQHEPEHDVFPRIQLAYPPEIKINPYTNKKMAYREDVYRSQKITEKDLFGFVSTKIPSRALRLSSENVSAFLKFDFKQRHHYKQGYPLHRQGKGPSDA